MDYLGISATKLKPVIKELNQLLADYHIYYQNLRCFHWNVVGQNFFDLHEKFEEMYDDAKLKVDEIAERILTLRFQPVSNYTDYLEMSNLKESPSRTEDSKMVKILLEDHGKILTQMRKVIEKADKAEDEGTIDMIGAYIADVEKISWMLDAWSMKSSDTHPEA